MASITFSGQLDQAMNEASAAGNKILFIPQQTVGEVLPGAASELVVESDGTYSITLAYNTYSIYHYSDVTKRRTLLATDIVVSADTAVSTIPDLIGSTVPVTEDSVLTIQGYLTDAQNSATAAAASEAAVTNRVAAYEVESTDYLINTFDGSALEVGDVVRTLGYYTAGDGGGAEWVMSDDADSVASRHPINTIEPRLVDSNGKSYYLSGDSNHLNAKKLGYVGGTDATNILIACRKYIDYGTVFVPNDGNGNCIITSDVTREGKSLKWSLDWGVEVEGGDLIGLISETRQNSGLDLNRGNTIDDFSPWANNNGYAFKATGKQSEGAGVPLMGVVLNDMPAQTASYPSAITGYAKIENDGNQGFGIFARIDCYGKTGTPKNEINVFNESGVVGDLSTQIGGVGGVTTSSFIPTCLYLAAGGDTDNAMDSSIGLGIGSEGGSDTGFRGGICIDPEACKDYGIAITGSDTRHIRLISNSDDSDIGPSLYLERDSSSPAGGDLIGEIVWTGKNLSDEEIVYSTIYSKINDASSSTLENGSMNIDVMFEGSLETAFKIDGNTKNNPIYLTVEGELKQVTRGAADSGGTGYRLLRVEN